MNRSNLDLCAVLPADCDSDGSRSVGNDLASALTWQKAIFEGSRDAIFIGDAASNFVLVNAAACELTGYSREELQGMKITDLHDEADLEAFQGYHSRILAGEEVLSEAVIRKKDGSMVLAEFNNRSIVVAGHVYMHSVARDITQWMQAKLDLQRAKEYAENLIQTANVMIIGLDAGGKVEVFNEAAEKISGYTWAEITGRRLADVVTPKDRYPEAWEFFRALQEGDCSCGQVFDSPILTKSGEERYISWRTNEILRQGRFSGIIAFGMDITVRVRVEQALRDSEEVYRQLVELSPDGISVHHGGRILFANTAAARMLGLNNPAELIGKSIIDTVHPDDREVMARRLQALTKAGDTTPPGELRFLPADGRVLIGGVASVALSYRGRLSVQTIARDITERKSLEEQLRQSQRMEAIGTLAGG
ncbi:MAG: PAS domain S-box protein, partial [Acidobacteriota bacterium]